jgi:hypothetical protein
MPNPSSDNSRQDSASGNGSRRISREIAILQQEIRDDFDQKLKELSGLMQRFKLLLGNDAQLDLGERQHTAANDAVKDVTSKASVTPLLPDQPLPNEALKNIPVLTDRVHDDIESSDSVANPKRVNPPGKAPADGSQTPEAANDPAPTPKPVSPFATEPARFETGLYHLNSQLYRFKLELDQELEFREEPLHVHFRHQSELAQVLQQITEKMQREKNAGR